MIFLRFSRSAVHGVLVIGLFHNVEMRTSWDENANAPIFSQQSWHGKDAFQLLFFSFFMMSHIDKTSWHGLKKSLTVRFSRKTKQPSEKSNRIKSLLLWDS